MEEIYTRIEAYLDGILSETELVVFEADVQADPALAAALADVREARERLARLWAQPDEEAALSQTLQALGKQHFGIQSTSLPEGQSANIDRSGQLITDNRQLTTQRWWWALVAALAAALLAWLAWPKGEPSVRLYAEFRHFPEASFTEKGSADAGGKTLVQAESDFNQKKYAAALAALQAHLAAHPNDLESKMFMGLCQLELGQTSDAMATFMSYQVSSGVWTLEARWYLALCHVRNKNWRLCTEVLLQIQPGEAHYEDAQRLIEQVKKQSK